MVKSEYNQMKGPMAYEDCRIAIQQLRNDVIEIGTHLLAYIDEQDMKPHGKKKVMTKAKHALSLLDIKVRLIRESIIQHADLM